MTPSGLNILQEAPNAESEWELFKVLGRRRLICSRLLRGYDNLISTKLFFFLSKILPACVKLMEIHFTEYLNNRLQLKICKVPLLLKSAIQMLGEITILSQVMFHNVVSFKLLSHRVFINNISLCLD